MTAAKRKIVVLDDDPTGTQTVHGVNVYTAWTPELLDRAFEDERSIFYILTNSRSLTADESRQLHTDLVADLISSSERWRVGMEIVSRSDSTLRGHYPLETDVIRRALEDGGRRVDGEILAPFFLEGGRITSGDIHYVVQDGSRVPASETEFARDSTFGYRSSNLRKWIEEKTGGGVSARDVVSIGIPLLRNGGRDAVADVLSNVTNDGRVVVNAETYDDMNVFVMALRQVLAQGKRFIYRTAASFVKAFAGIADRALLTADDLGGSTPGEDGGLVLVGSHVKRTTDQLDELIARGPVRGIELSVPEVVDGDADSECRRVLHAVDATLGSGSSAVVYTSRQVMTSAASPTEGALEISTRISGCMAGIVRCLTTRPRFVVAKGGITSSDVATKGLGIRCAEVLGQIHPGVPVWRQGKEARYPGGTLVVFPGNVGNRQALLEVVEALAG